MKQTIAVTIFVGLSAFFSSKTDTKEEKEIVFQSNVYEPTTEELLQRTELYRKTEHIEKVADSFHIEVQKLRENEKTTERLTKIPVR